MVTTADALPLIADDTWSITEITYAFPTDVSNYPSDYGLLGELDSFAAMPGSAVPLFEAAFRNYAEVINMDFRPAETGETAVIDIASSTAGNFAWAYFPSTSREGGDMWFNTNAHNFGPLVSPPTNFHGIYVYHTILHELGHAMGLLHGHDVLPSDVDGMENSVMTYRSYVGDPIAAGYNNIAGHFSQSLMRLDIAALQDMYGANFNTAAGDTTYHFDPNTGRVTRDGELLSNPSENVLFLTLWDGNGNDTFDFSDYSTDLNIDLTPGAGSSVDAFGTTQRARLDFTVDAPAHVYTALAPNGDTRALFENAIGGSGNDSFTGNAAANEFRGGLGGDRYVGLGGWDTFAGTTSELAGDRVADFTRGDAILIEGAPQNVTATAGTGGLEIGFSGGAILLEGSYESTLFEVSQEAGATRVEIADDDTTQLTEANDRFITTDAADNRVFGAAGDDVIVTSGGADMLSGGAGFDVLLGGDDADILVGGAAGDRLTGGSGGDTFSFDISDISDGIPVADFITDFEIGVDLIELSGFGYNGIGDLTFTSLAAGDAINLGSNAFIVLEGISSADLSDTDFAMPSIGRSSTLISQVNRHVLSDAGDRFVTGDADANEVFAGDGIDAVIGGEGADILRGEAGADALTGGGGNDRLIGGSGSDRLEGRAGNDVFEFTAGEESGFTADFIADFETGDSVLLSGFGFSDFSQLSFGNSVAGDVTLELASATHIIVFEGVSDAAALSDAFAFA